MSHIGRLIAEARVRANLTQAELARAMGISQGMVSTHENQESMNTDTLQKYARALGVTFEVGS